VRAGTAHGVLQGQSARQERLENIQAENRIMREESVVEARTSPKERHGTESGWRAGVHVQACLRDGEKKGGGRQNKAGGPDISARCPWRQCGQALVGQGKVKAEHG
jgi:hypothetical protein